VEISRVYLGVDPVKEAIPVQPTAHYAMGGIPTDLDGRVILDADRTPVYGLYAAGEVACVSVHGANRLGTNSLTDLVVFGRRAGQHMARFSTEIDLQPLAEGDPEEWARSEIERILSNSTEEATPAKIRNEMQETMTRGVGIFRKDEGMRRSVAKLAELQQRFKQVGVTDKGKRFNTDLLETIELGNLLDMAQATAVCAVNRTESRGAHSREDFPDRDDENWLKHSLITRTGEEQFDITYKPVVINQFEPKERTY
jgi:succinate dehydrogenase / fumarate reductase flavoprotein subunit